MTVPLVITPILANPSTLRDRMRLRAVEGLHAAFPMTIRNHTIELHDAQVLHKDFGPNDQKRAIIEGNSLTEPVKATLVMKDAAGKEVEKIKNFTLLQLPYFTERHSFILDGNEYQVANQLRMKPGVYARKRANDELEATFNLSKGANFRLSIDPQKGHPYLEYQTTQIPLYPILRKLGVPHQDIAAAWGAEVAGANSTAFNAKMDSAVDKLYGKLIHPSKQTALTTEAKVDAIHSAYAATAMDPEVTEVTLGHRHEKVNPGALLDASKKLLNIYKSGEDVDDRDSLAFKTFHSVEDYIKERISLDARALANKVKGRSTHKTTLREIMPSSPFTGGIRSFIIGSQLSSIPTQINPMELVDHAVKVTSLGEGGISSERAIPLEARQLHATHLGILDPVRTPEAFTAGVDIRTSLLASRDAKGNLYTPMRNVRTGKLEMLSAKEIAKKVVAFPGEKLTGMVAAMKDGKVQHVPANQIEYAVISSSQLYSPASNLVPMMESLQGNRATMGAKMQTQALPLVGREPPLVQVGSFHQEGKALTSWEQEFAKFVVPTAPKAGRVVKIDSQYIYIDPTHTKKAEEGSWVKRADDVKKKIDFQGVPLHIDRPKGFVKKFKDSDAEVEYLFDYGFVPGVFDDDGEELDVYVGENADAPRVYIVDKYKKAGGPELDEHKVFMGFDSKAAAIKAFDHHVLPSMRGPLSDVSLDAFKSVLETMGDVKVAAEKDLIKVPYETDFPFASKTYHSQTIDVKVGDHVHEDQPMANSNFTKDHTLALGRNMKVGYMAYYGLNSNDAVVISEGAAEKLTSEHMYKEILSTEPEMVVGRDIHRQFYGTKYTADQYRKLDADGVIRRGQKLLPHDPMIVGVQKTTLSAHDAILGNFDKTLVKPYREVVRTWDHDFEGEVTDVYSSPKRVVVTVKTREPMRVGDKLAGRIGNKGVVSTIIPDNKMIQDESGKPIDILITSQGVISRINPEQIIETAVGKVAQKTGKPIIVENFTGKNNVEWAKKLLKEHGLKDKETVFDPVSQKHIPGVLVGPQYILRLFKTTDSNYSARDAGMGYDVNQQPTKGGHSGALGFGQMEFNALVAHNARNVLKEASVVKSQKNDAFWRAIQLGLPLPPMKPSFAYDKFVAMLHGAGIRIDQKGSKGTLVPLTDKDTLKLSHGAIENDKLIRSRDLRPEKGGFFDPAITGGTTGTHWSHIDLAEPILNPVFVEPARRLLGLTNAQFASLHSDKGGQAIKSMLNKIDVAQTLKDLHRDIKTLPASKLDDAVKKIKYLTAVSNTGLKLGDAYVMTKLPVVPPIMRPILPGKGGQEMVVGDSNYLYQNLMLHNKQLQKQVEHPILPDAEHAQLRNNLFNAVGAVIGTHDTDNPKLEKRNVKGFLEHITGKTNPKSSYVQKRLLKKQQDISGRGTAVPDGSLGIDDIGIPEDMLWTMFGKFAISRLVRRGFGAVNAKQMVEDRHPAARDAILAEAEERPVIMNRAPSLHRYNMIGAYAKMVPGKTIRVNPFVEPHLNLDYDGDTLQIHAPVLPAAVAEVRKMTLSNLVFGDKERDQLLVKPAMEAILGIHLSSLSASNSPVRKFNSAAEAMAAYKAGTLKLNDRIEIKK